MGLDVSILHSSLIQSEHNINEQYRNMKMSFVTEIYQNILPAFL